jgi:spore coat polysaccharide biosynthesis protein SpsF
MAEFKTEQEQFWAGEFGAGYISRNQGSKLLASNLSFFGKALHTASPVNTCIEFGSNIGMNLRALKLLYPEQEQHAVEINPTAADQLRTFLPAENVYNQSILEFQPHRTWDLTMIRGVLIHIDPVSLPVVYDALHKAAGRYLLVCEYYNPTPVALPYRGHDERLFKRDFCGEILDRYSDLKLVDYGFAYRRDPHFPLDDINWFLMEKTR